MTVSLAPEPARSPSRELSVWPASARTAPHGDVTVAGVALTEIAERFGTPVYVLDEAEVRRRCRAYRAAFPDTDVLYAAKAFLCRAMAHWVREEGLGLDVCSAGELELAVTAGFPPERMVLHGNAKSPEDLRAALRLGVGRIVVDSTGEIARLAAQVPAGTRQKVLLRITPGIAAGSHAAVRTGTDDQKFGLSLADGTAQHAVARVLGQPRLELAGLHCHLGSQIDSVKPYLSAVRRLVGLLARIRRQHGVTLPELDLGGGHAVAYRPGERALDVAALAVRVRAELAASCAAADLPVPRLAVEPGRAIAAPAGVALYRVPSVKRGGDRTFVAVDGGMSDNPRPALYGVGYAPRLVGRRSGAAPVPVTVVGRHCEAGDVLAADVPLPGDIRAGDLVAVPVSGAYQVSMASGYNLVGRPPVVAVADGRARLLVRRESLTDLSSRDVGL
ncbi:MULTISPECIES: diaminopimelate decarboxylase [Streptomycetaceae]|uniref:Diaminopimelate decarboxylase n=1 Tax=Streptantibioticus cattleyicolor (strain ATCC 35852 / DSM 46488 / JCM 4925 / NBRC 14057 / NRRL 8057) TaxID=1003195 RepID=F8JQQ8_STREN|nr:MULTISPECIES: diaminopimelate decarboxylase [Streptomycetaceae]AEW92789.1 diaminopimelate decarboxylase [Streptantibioticus cattleyicolor NRRL 8057 = DSM 46488]MYS57551.1 diaminopimelate decarboxylase [Streptomyces sp. SID5468]CCB73143.1 Diaminopimelate decarboxylase [Streptantibioticus cattleyicolor NRRL 8057 = DSM 46488]